MEYLEMHGTVKLKPDADITLTIDVLNKLQETEFVDAATCSAQTVPAIQVMATDTQ